MIHYGYTASSLLGVIIAATLDLVVLRTRILRTKLFWATYAIVLFFQLVVNGVLTGLGIVTYDPRLILGGRVAYAPLEDLGFGFALVTLTITLWVRLEQRARRPGSRPAMISRSTNQVTEAERVTAAERVTVTDRTAVTEETQDR